MDIAKQRNLLLQEIKIYKPISDLYNVFIEYDDRLQNNIFVKAKNEEEALNIAELYAEEIGDEITDTSITQMYKENIISKNIDNLPNNFTTEQYYWAAYFEEGVENKLKTEKAYCWDAGT